jgi:large subunit ribosomal protein L29
MKYQDIQALGNKELVEKFREEKKRLQKMKFQNAVAQIERPHQLKEARKEVARLLTELNARRSKYEMQAMMNKMSQSNEN